MFAASNEETGLKALVNDLWQLDNTQPQSTNESSEVNENQPPKDPLIKISKSTFIRKSFLDNLSKCGDRAKKDFISKLVAKRFFNEKPSK